MVAEADYVSVGEYSDEFKEEESDTERNRQKLEADL